MRSTVTPAVPSTNDANIIMKVKRDRVRAWAAVDQALPVTQGA